MQQPVQEWRDEYAGSDHEHDAADRIIDALRNASIQRRPART
jgi:hypothetical protein